MRENGKPQISQELLNLARAGDREAMAALYDCTHQEVYRTAHALLRDEDLVLDVQQETYLHAFSHLDQLRDAGSFLPWLRKIAVNEARSQLRKRTPLLFSELNPDEADTVPEPTLRSEDPDADPALHLEQKENARLVREILDELSDGQRMLVAMYYYENVPIKQIAETLQISPGTVKSQLARSRRKVEERVRRLEQEGVKLYGFGPIPFLVALLRNETPVVEAGKRAIPSAALHVGRTFFETALGRVVLGGLSVLMIGGGFVGYAAWKDYRENASLTVQHTTDPSVPSELLFTPPIQPELVTTSPIDTAPAPPDTSADATPEDLPAETTTEPESTEPETTEPETTEPETTEPKTTEPKPTAPTPTVTEPTTPQATEPEGSSDSEENLIDAPPAEAATTQSSGTLPTEPPYPPKPGTVTISLGETWTFHGTGTAADLVFLALPSDAPAIYESAARVGTQTLGAANISFTPTEPGTYTIYYSTAYRTLFPWATVIVTEG